MWNIPLQILVIILTGVARALLNSYLKRMRKQPQRYLSEDIQ